MTLVDLRIGSGSLQENSRYTVSARFCHIDWKLQKQNPSTVPMFKDVQTQSTLCPGTMMEVDLMTIAEQAREFDKAVQADPSKKKVVTSVYPPTGVVFHETRCGSTLAANMLASFSPAHSRVYSESPPPVTALRACPNGACDRNMHKKMIEDLFYMMGRIPAGEDPQHVFFKFQSITTHYIHEFTRVFPDVPWVFLYRDSVEVMMSHFKGGEDYWIGRTPVCARSFKQMQQPKITQEMIDYRSIQRSDMTKTQYCAAHLVSADSVANGSIFCNFHSCLISILILDSHSLFYRLVSQSRRCEKMNVVARVALSTTTTCPMPCGRPYYHMNSTSCRREI